MISERLLRKWRFQALEELHRINHSEMDTPYIKSQAEVHERILRLTQELLDQHLLEKGKKS